MNAPRTSQGSMAMEAVIVLPIFVIIIFVILQISLVWGAKQLVAYAAYCGARAALVYNPADYEAERQKDGHWATVPLAAGGSRGGVVHFAACTVLSWMSWSLTDQPAGDVPAGMKGSDFMLGGSTPVPLSSQIRRQVRVEVREFETIREDEQRRGDDMDDGVAETPIERQFPAVTVRVRFDFPLFIPLGGAILGYFFGAGETRVDTTGAFGPVGFVAPEGETVHAYMEATGRYMEDKSGLSYYSIPLEESCTMAKPYKTDTFPRMSKEERAFMEIF